MSTVSGASLDSIALPGGSALRLFLQCHDRLLAVDTAPVERVLLVSESAAVRPAGEVTEAPQGWLGVLDLDAGVSYAAWDLGEMFGLGMTSRAWILMGIGAAGGVRRALRTDACLHVGPPEPRGMRLPPGAIRERREAFRGAFRTQGGRGVVSVGFDVDLETLWTPREIQWSGDVLAQEGAEGA